MRQNNEEGGTSPYGPQVGHTPPALIGEALSQLQAWEFKHPEFKANNRDSLDNIRRKAPAPRKSAQYSDEQMPIQQVDLLNQQLVAQQQQLEALSQRYADLQLNHQMMLQQLMGVQKTVVNHEHVMQQVMTFLHSVDAKQRRDSRTANPFSQAGDVNQGASLTTTTQQIAKDEEVPASPLQNATKLLNEFNADVQFNQFNMANLEQMNQLQGRSHGMTPPIDQTGQPGLGQAPTSAGSSSTMGYAKLNGELETVVYPVGTINGIDPTYSEHVNNIPYPLPSKEVDPTDPRRQYADGRKKSAVVDPGWARAPNILLVEDDPTCRQIGGKFLYSFGCAIDSAVRTLTLTSLAPLTIPVVRRS